MPEIKVQHQCASKDDLVLTETFGEAIGPLPKQTDSGFFEEGNLISGTWECEPGILEGHWVITSESGQVTEVKAGDSFVFPNGWKGVAEVKEKLRKVYMMIL